eukprot:2619239-Ditylum_brightwellii.AAC.1
MTTAIGGLRPVIECAVAIKNITVMRIGTIDLLGSFITVLRIGASALSIWCHRERHDVIMLKTKCRRME